MAISDEITRHLERLILDGGLAPGQKIPSERQLASRLGVSRAVVREALHELQGRGMIETRHGRGSFVASIVRDGSVIDEDSTLLNLYADYTRTIYDLLEVREQLEGQAAFLAAERANGMDRYRITQAFERLGETDPLSNAEPDHDFHQAIVDASHNPVLIHILTGLKNMMFLTVQASVANLNPRRDMRGAIMKQHRQLYNAIMAGKATSARRIATSHVRFVIQSLEALEAAGTPVVRVGKSLH